MSAASRRAARRELEAARAVGGERIRHRPRFIAAPDVLPVRLASGEVLQVETKTRKALPRLLVRAIAQARRYTPDAIPLAVISEIGGEALAVLPLRDLARLLGLRPSEPWSQLVLAAREEVDAST